MKKDNRITAVFVDNQAISALLTKSLGNHSEVLGTKVQAIAHGNILHERDEYRDLCEALIDRFGHHLDDNDEIVDMAKQLGYFQNYEVSG